MFDFLPDNYNETALLYVAISAFIFAVLFEFWRRASEIKKQKSSAPLSDRMEKAVHYFGERKNRKKITNDIYQKLTDVSDSTASRDLEKLQELGFLERKGKTSGIYYIFTSRAKTHTKTHKQNRGKIK